VFRVLTREILEVSDNSLAIPNREAKGLNPYRVLFVAGCPNSIRISKAIAAKLREISKKKVKIELINTYKFEPDKAFKKTRSVWKALVGDNRVIITKEILEKKNPDIIIVGDDGGINAFVVKLAQLNGIPTLAVQVGMLSKESKKSIKTIFKWRKYFLWRLFSKIISNRLIAKILILVRWKVRVLEWGLGGTDFIALMGEYYKKLMIKRGVPPHKIVVCGYVLLDEITKLALSQKQPKALDNIPGLKQIKKMILLVSQPLVEDEICSLKKYVSTMEPLIKNLNSDYQLIIKPHPREDMSKYASFAKKFPERVILTDPEYNLGDLASNAKIVVTFHSTAGLITLVHRKPLVVLDLIRFSYVNPLRDLGVTIDTIERLKDFAQNPSKFIKNSNVDYDGTILRYLYRLDGNAALRVARVILKMIGRI